MPHSFTEQRDFTCPACGQSFKADVWLVVDAGERPDLLELARIGDLHRVICPNGHAVQLDSPLLFYLPRHRCLFLLSRANGAAANQYIEQAADLVASLRERMGLAWEKIWMTPGLPVLPLDLFPLVLTNGLNAALHAWASKAAHKDEVLPILSEFLLLPRQASAAEKRYQQTNDLSALDQAVIAWEGTLSHPNFAAAAQSFRLDVFNRAGVTYLYRYWAGATLTDLHQALSCWQQAVDLAPQDSPDFTKYLNNLGTGLSARYGAIGDLVDLEGAITAFRQAVALTPRDSPNLPMYLANLGVGLRNCYASTGKLATLEAAITAFQQAADLTPQNSPERPTVLNTLGVGLRDRYARTGNSAHLEAAIGAWKQAIDLTPPGTPELPMYLSNLGNGMRDRYAQNSNLADLEMAIDAFQQAIDLTPQSATDLPMYLTNLGNGLSDRSACTGSLADLEAAIAAFQHAADLTPRDSPDLPSRLTNLGTGLRDRYASTSSPDDLEAAIGVFRQAVELTPQGAPELPGHLTNLGAGLSARYAATGSLADLEAAIAAFQQAADLTPRDSPERPAILTNLGTGLHDRYARRGNLADLEAALAAFQQAVNLTAHTAANLPMYLANLGGGLRDRYTRTNELADLEAAINAFRQAADLASQGSLSLPLHLTNLGAALRDRYARTGDPTNLEAAITAFQQAADLTPQDSPEYHAVLNNLGTGLSARYVHTSDLADLEAAIHAYRQASEFSPQGAPDLPMYLTNLGHGLSERYTRTSKLTDQQDATASYRQACMLGLNVALEWALMSSRNWGKWALERTAWEEAAQAYGFGLEAIECLFRTQLLRANKETWLREAQELPGPAAYALARSGELARAVEALEQGRACLLAEALERARADLECLPTIGHGELYQRYRAAAERTAQLQTAELHQESVPLGFDLTAELRASRAALDAAIESIQQIPGYADFFHSPDFKKVTELLTHPTDGNSNVIAIVYLTVTPVGSLALILHSGGVQPIWLDTTEADLDPLLVKREGETVLGGYLPAQLGMTPLPAILDETLPWLGERFMQPLAIALDELSPASTSDADPSARLVILVPAGRLALLPLHAASYQRDGQDYAFLDDFAVAYIPSARVLGSCCEELSSLSNSPATLLVVGNPLPLPSGRQPLTFARVEAEKVSTFFDGRTTLLCETQAISRDVQVGIGRHSYLHFACHGEFKLQHPLTSGMILSHGERLTLADLYAHPALKGTRLAVLSACQTAVTDFNDLPEEAVGLPAGFLQAGVPGVVGSLWSVNDLSTAHLMAKCYEFHLHGDPATGAGPMSPAGALRRAQQWLREATAQEMALADSWERYHRASGGRDRDAYRWMRYYRANPDERPFAHPYYWAAFAFSGA